MNDLNEQILRLQSYIKLLKKEKQTKKIEEELAFQKERLNKLIGLVKAN